MNILDLLMRDSLADNVLSQMKAGSLRAASILEHALTQHSLTTVLTVLTVLWLVEVSLLSETTAASILWPPEDWTQSPSRAQSWIHGLSLALQSAIGQLSQQ